MMEVVKKESQSRFDVSSDDEDIIKEGTVSLWNNSNIRYYNK